MEKRDVAIRKLLSGVMPLDNIGPHLRQSVRRALHSADHQRIRLVARVVFGELLRRGDLIRVAVEGADPANGPYCLVNGTNRLIDVSPLSDTTIPAYLPQHVDKPVPSRVESPEIDIPDTLVNLVGDFSGMLGAMEQAQDLDIGEPQSGEKEVILASILRLLGQFTPQFDLYILLTGSNTIPDDQTALFQINKKDPMPLWLSMRQEGQTIWLPSPTELPEHILDPDTSQATQSDRTRPRVEAIAVPLWGPPEQEGQDAPTVEEGLFFLVADEHWDRTIMQRLADRLSRFVTRRWQYQRDVNQRIHTDSLTKVKNRAFFDSQFTLELERARRSQLSLTLILVDLDHFKKINDQHGHHVGDRVLRLVARRLHEELRRIDHICRIGGEEFALILPDTSLDAGQEVITRLINTAFMEEIVHHDTTQKLTVTASYGVVTFPDAGTDAFELYRKADAMLYLSKDLGRNQCHIWSSQGDHLQLKPHLDTV